MTVLPLFHFFTALVYLYLSVYAVIKNPKAWTNRLFAMVLSCFTIWSAAYIFIHTPSASRETASFFLNISALGWTGFGGFFLLFALAFCDKKQVLKKLWFYPILFAIPLFILIQQWGGNVFGELRLHDYGWKPVFTSSWLLFVYFFYTYATMLAGLGLILKFTLKTRNFGQKRQGWITLVTIVATLILGSTTNFFLPVLKVDTIPDVANFFVLIWALGAAYSMAKYKFLIITPATAAENIISTIFDCLILLDMKGCIVRVNSATLTLSGYSEKELIGRSVTKLFKHENPNPADGAGNGKGVPEDIIHMEKGKNNELIFCAKDGRDIPILFSTSMLKDDQNNAAGFVCVAKDISERKKLEEETLKTKKLESIGVLAGGIAHDFNNLLSVIIGNLVLARDEMGNDTKGLTFLENAEEAANIAAELAGKFITFSRGGWMNKEKIVLSYLLRDLCLPLPTKANGKQDTDVLKRVELNVRLSQDLNPIRGDETQILQVIQGVLLNAVESFPEGRSGKIEITGENIDVSEESQLPLKTGQYVKLCIEDNGKGIAPEYREKVFDPYFSTKDLNSQKGMGLGLTICYSIIKKHGGHITVESNMGEGTVVTLFLPSLPRD